MQRTHNLCHLPSALNQPNSRRGPPFPPTRALGDLPRGLLRAPRRVAVRAPDRAHVGPQARGGTQHPHDVHPDPRSCPNGTEYRPPPGHELDE